jgi:hypothetical protein
MYFLINFDLNLAAFLHLAAALIFHKVFQGTNF